LLYNQGRSGTGRRRVSARHDKFPNRPYIPECGSLPRETSATWQALSFRNAEGLGKGTAQIYRELNNEFRVYDNTGVFHDELVKFRKILFSNQLLDDLQVYWE
ncbi:hypothetical protein D4R89_00105, partial [bacterium]